jgi:hypothetical protein
MTMGLDESIDARERQTIRAGDTDGVRLSFADYLRTGETLSSVSSIEITGTSTNITVTGAAVSTGALTILGKSVAAANAVTFTVAPTTAATVGLYQVTLTTATSNSRVAKRRIALNVVT